MLTTGKRFAKHQAKQAAIIDDALYRHTQTLTIG